MQNLQCFSNELQKSSRLGCQLIRTHASEGRLCEAVGVFNSLQEKNVYAWTALISAYVQHHQSDDAILVYNRMRSEGISPNSHTFFAVLKACAGHCHLNVGKLLHYQIVDQDCRSGNFIENALIYMYASCGCVEDAWDVFSKLPGRPDAISWASLICGCAQHGHGHVALQLFLRMLQYGSKPNEFTLICIINSCTDLHVLKEGRLVHACVLKQNCEQDKYIGCSLLNLYAKCGSIEDAFKVFEGLNRQTVVAWSSMILGYAEHGHAAQAIHLFQQMQSKGVVPNEITFVCVLKACWKLSALEDGKEIHAFLVKLGIDCDVLIGSTLIDMYATCGKLEDAYKVFDKLVMRNVVCWSIMISGYEEHGDNEEALRLYYMMQLEGAQADQFLYVIIINVCTNLKALDHGETIHAEITKLGFASDLYVGSNLVDMYAKCGRLPEAFWVFNHLSARDVVAWSAVIEGFSMQGCEEEALQLFQDMLKDEMEPNEVTFLSVLKACTSMSDLRIGNIVYMYTIELGLESVRVIGNTLVDMYAKCGALEEAHRVFDKLLLRDVVSWNALIGGYADIGYGWEALQLSEKLQSKGLVDADEFTVMAILKACSSMAASDHGKLIHAELVKRGFENEMAICNSLVNMYAKCGSLVDAHKVVDEPLAHSMVSWNALIGGCADHGHMTAAKSYFKRMQTYNLQPNEVTFINLLSGCNHAGWIEEGYYLLQFMQNEYSLTPTIRHFICLMDILGRAGCLGEAEDLVFMMPFEPDAFMWMSLLSSCEKHGYLQQGEEVFNFFLQAADTTAAAYVLMSNISVAKLSG
ncbi:hypothetical protein GOP47_0006906 [Adiantum capillus-veneris]|uniref:Pentatricopeptide repeat-containing protein n=1 Tax=Adiantum capillus-veneris TaxID=13818 RepID=A0A9D4V4B2_ADICA|nr:hypothetical protein GOP47_0006906 [Adiantum capillus-veneris]